MMADDMKLKFITDDLEFVRFRDELFEELAKKYVLPPYFCGIDADTPAIVEGAK